MKNNEKKYALAVIIPAFKALYFRETLQSFTDQTNKNFTLYIADDCGPAEIKDISEEFSGKIDLRYVRFDKNMGNADLVGHWNRSIRLSEESWVWLFSDDDIVLPNCVEKFYEALVNTSSGYDIYAFNTCLIDKNGETINISPSLPQKESVNEFIYHRLAGQRHNCAVNHIFSRQTFDDNNGLVRFELAWYSDDASWIAFAGRKGFYTIDNAYVKFRSNSSANLSTPKPGYRRKKIIALFDYLSWLLNKYEMADINGIKLNQGCRSKLLRRWIFINLEYIGGVPFLMIAYVLKKMRLFYGSNRIKNAIAVCLINFRVAKKFLYEK